MDLGLQGKTAVVSGSTAGIGFAIAAALAAEGARVIINGRTETRVAAALGRIRQRANNADVRGTPPISALPRVLRHSFGRRRKRTSS
jgi:NAD(P)-dependent dehydrogenase (short-subunit alcohol dehydrogenase family)